MKKFLLLILLIIILNRSDVLKMKYIEPYEKNGKCWHGVFYKPNEFLNSVWLTDKEYYKLLDDGKIKTKFRGKDIDIIIYKEEKC